MINPTFCSKKTLIPMFLYKITTRKLKHTDVVLAKNYSDYLFFDPSKTLCFPAAATDKTRCFLATKQ